MSIANLVGEDKDAWKYYLKKGKIKNALASCRTAKQRAAVNGTHAESLFLSGNYPKAAQFYALSNFSFETVAMKFLKYKQIAGLEQYLLKVLEVYKKSKMSTDNTIQRKVLCTWIVELQLTRINETKANNTPQLTQSTGLDSDDQLQLQILAEAMRKNIADMEAAFHRFLVENGEDLDQDTVLQLLQSHGKIDDCIKYADATKQY